jgi:GT2 family glycosyltransferase
MIRAIIPTLDADHAHQCVERVRANAGAEAVYHIIADTRRRGWVWVTTQGLDYVSAHDYVLFLNDDVAMSDDWLRILKNTLDAYHDPLRVGFVGPSGRCRTPPQNSGRPGDMRPPQLVHHLSGFCMLIHPRVEVVLDTEFIHYAAEVALQRASGWLSMWAPIVYCQHGLHRPRLEWWRHDQSLLYEKYGGIL